MKLPAIIQRIAARLPRGHKPAQPGLSLAEIRAHREGPRQSWFSRPPSWRDRAADQPGSSHIGPKIAARIRELEGGDHD